MFSSLGSRKYDVDFSDELQVVGTDRRRRVLLPEMKYQMQR